MKRIHILSFGALIALALASCSSADRKNDLERFGIKGPVKQITELIQSRSLDSLVLSSDPSDERTEFDVMRVMDFYPNGLIKNLRVITEDGTLVQKYTYDQDSLLTEMQSFADGQPGTYETYEYDSKGRQTNITVYDPKGTALLTIDSEYDRHGNVVLKFSRDPKTKMTRKEYFKYNDRNQLIETTSSDNGRDAKLSTSYQYNEYGDISVQTETDSLFDVYSIAQNFVYRDRDSLGNWGGREIIVNDMVTQKVERTIEYYE